jgi:molybdate transport system regulatory protein
MAMFGNTPGWGLKVRVWVERDGRKVLGRGRVELLRLIDRRRSISAAAREMGMSYRRAWGLVRDMNEAAGGPLVAVTTGGPGGGGAALTPGG